MHHLEKKNHLLSVHFDVFFSRKPVLKSNLNYILVSISCILCISFMCYIKEEENMFPHFSPEFQKDINLIPSIPHVIFVLFLLTSPDSISNSALLFVVGQIQFIFDMTSVAVPISNRWWQQSTDSLKTSQLLNSTVPQVSMEFQRTGTFIFQGKKIIFYTSNTPFKHLDKHKGNVLVLLLLKVKRLCSSPLAVLRLICESHV